MLGALRLPAREVAQHVGAVSPASVATVAVPVVVGGLAVVALDRYSDGLEY
jgi:hypothetical protein